MFGTGSFEPFAAEDPPELSVADTSILEGLDGRFEVSIPAPAATDVTVTATTSTGSAGAADFTATSQEVFIPAGLTNAGFVVTTLDDTLDEPAETFTVTLSDPSGATIGDGSATGTIEDKSMFRIGDPVPVTEGGTLRFPVTLDHAAASDVTVILSTLDDTAQAPGDYSAEDETEVTIPAGDTEAFFDVVTVGDALDEDDETVAVSYEGVTGPAGPADIEATGTILDDDGPQVSIADASIIESAELRFTVSLASPAAADVAVTATTSDGTATGAADYTSKSQQLTIPAGQTQAEFLVETLDDTLDEPAETLTVTLSSPSGTTIGDGSATGTIVDRSRITVAAPQPVAEGGTLRFPVRLDHAAASAVSVRLRTDDGTAIAPGDYTAHAETVVTIPAGQTEVPFDVVTREDLLDETDETVTVRVLGSSGPATPVTFTVNGTIQDKPAPTVSVAGAPAVTEGGSLAFPVRLSAPKSGTVTVTLTTQDGSAQAPHDYTATTHTVTIPPGQTEVPFVVPTVDDGFDEPDETVTVLFQRSTNASPTVLRATGAIQDNDEPLPEVRVDAPAAVDEGDPLRFPVRLDRAAPGPVDIRLSTADGTATAPGDYTAQSLTLVRIPAGATEAFLEVPTLNDGLAESDETVRAEIRSGTNVSLSVLRATGTIGDAPVRLVPGRLLGGRLLSGNVRVRPPRSPVYIDLGAAAGLPVGTQVDVTEGMLELTSALRSAVPFASQAGRTQRLRLSGGVFTIRQGRRSAPVTLALSGRELARCGRGGRKPVRRLWAEGGGRFVVKGRYAESSSSGGRWLTEDRCDSTRVKVARGRATVKDTVRRKARTLRKGRALTVRARR